MDTDEGHPPGTENNGLLKKSAFHLCISVALKILCQHGRPNRCNAKNVAILCIDLIYGLSRNEYTTFSHSPIFLFGDCFEGGLFSALAIRPFETHGPDADLPGRRAAPP